MISKPVVRIATQNRGKLAEYERLLSSEFDVRGLGGLNLELPPEGTTSYRENAEAKARFVAEATGELSLGDDSGIEAEALGGLPGILSARFAGEPVSDERNIEKLLNQLDAVSSSNRAAEFVCWVAIASPDGSIESLEGRCPGTVGFAPQGTNGFGYDPIFLLSDGRTMAELSDPEKDMVSHRGRAVRAVLPLLRTSTRMETFNG